MKTFIYIILIAGVLGVSCHKSTKTPEPPNGCLDKWVVGHYVASYISATPNIFTFSSNVVLLDTQNRLDVQTVKNFVMNIGIIGANALSSDNFYAYYSSDAYHYQKYIALASKYHDTLYNLEGSKYEGFAPSPCLIDTISNIAVTCNKDYDANHPAGSSLNDIMVIAYCTPGPIIKAGKNAAPKSDLSDILYGTTLDSFNRFIDLHGLIGMSRYAISCVGAQWPFGVLLSLKLPPTYTDVYTFSVVMTLKNGMAFNFPTTKTTSFVNGWNGVVKLQGSK